MLPFDFEVDTVLAASAASCSTMLVVRRLAPPRAPLARRVEPYLALSRSRLGTGARTSVLSLMVPNESTSAVRSVFGPLLGRQAERLSQLIDTADNEQLERRLRQAGHADPDVHQHRMRQLAWALTGCIGGLLLGMLVFGSSAGALVLFGCFAIAGLSMQRGSLDRAIRSRNERIRSEVPAFAQLLAVHLRTGHGPVEALRHVVRRLDGPVAGECREALGLIAGGLTPQAVFEDLALATAEPAAARLYRLLASSIRAGGDIVAPLLAIAAELRAEHREAIARRSVQRRSAMVIPLLLLVAPVMVLFVAAALPSLVFGAF